MYLALWHMVDMHHGLTLPSTKPCKSMTRSIVIGFLFFMQYLPSELSVFPPVPLPLHLHLPDPRNWCAHFLAFQQAKHKLFNYLNHLIYSANS